MPIIEFTKEELKELLESISNSYAKPGDIVISKVRNAFQGADQIVGGSSGLLPLDFSNIIAKSDKVTFNNKTIEFEIIKPLFVKPILNYLYAWGFRPLRDGLYNYGIIYSYADLPNSSLCFRGEGTTNAYCINYGDKYGIDELYRVANCNNVYDIVEMFCPNANMALGIYGLPKFYNAVLIGKPLSYDSDLVYRGPIMYIDLRSNPKALEFYFIGNYQEYQPNDYSPVLCKNEPWAYATYSIENLPGFIYAGDSVIVNKIQEAYFHIFGLVDTTLSPQKVDIFMMPLQSVSLLHIKAKMSLENGIPTSFEEITHKPIFNLDNVEFANPISVSIFYHDKLNKEIMIIYDAATHKLHAFDLAGLKETNELENIKHIASYDIEADEESPFYKIYYIQGAYSTYHNDAVYLVATQPSSPVQYLFKESDFLDPKYVVLQINLPYPVKLMEIVPRFSIDNVNADISISLDSGLTWIKNEQLFSYPERVKDFLVKIEIQPLGHIKNLAYLNSIQLTGLAARVAF